MKKINIDIPQWSQGVIAIALLGGIVLIAYKINKKIKDTKDSKNENLTIDLSDDIYKSLLNQGKKLSFSKESYSILANDIETKLGGCETKITEQKVVGQIKDLIKSKIDWYFLVKTFGLRKIEDCGFGETLYALPELLKDQLDTGDWTGLTDSTFVELSNYLSKIGVKI